MTKAILFPPSALAVFFFALASGAYCQSENEVGDLVRVDTNNPPPGKPFTVFVCNGGLVQLSVQCRALGKENLRTLKIQIKGDALEKIAVAEVPVPAPGGKTTDNSRKDLSWFLKAVKVGDATVRITPLGVDGKDRGTRELLIRVYTKKR